MMKVFVASLALAAVVASPALADSAKRAKAHTAHNAARYVVVPAPAPVQGFSPYIHHPSYDTYVNGEYAGSDPDPRIRATLRREYCEESLDGC